MESLFFSDLFGGGLVFVENGPAWHQMKQTVQPMFNRQSVRKKLDLFTKCTSILIDKLHQSAKNNISIDIQDEFQKLTFDIICLITLGINFNSQQDKEGSKFGRAWDVVLEHLRWKAIFSLFPYWKIYKTAGIKKYEASMELLNKVIYDRLKDNVEEESIIGLLIKKRNSGHPLSDRDIRNEVITFLFAGHDTTTNLLTWCLYYLAINPEVLKKAQNEIDEVIGNEAFSDNVDNLSYLKSILKETLRLKPSVPLRGRRVIKDYNFHHHKIHKGSHCQINLYQVQRDPSIWSDPEKFDADRFKDSSLISSGAWIPFGFGPRRCIGEHMAMTEALVIIGTIIREFNFVLVPGQKIEDELKITLRARNGVKLLFSSRKTN
eukprot:TRINITY_DN6125_c0_g1_i1.p1 TRINITY_DN6125_c0_g1~~TRINITY_DN6125_c0_g1_i1.p1  ORF type:complete len:377 (-),score=45.01 TRINITY_DN6125_c0_g1_i1:71-1201(-)